MKAKLEQKNWDFYEKKHKRQEFFDSIQKIKNDLELDNFLKEFCPKKTDEELIEEFKKKYPDLELSENQKIVVNNLY
jgi:ribosomal protein S3AE